MEFQCIKKFLVCLCIFALVAARAPPQNHVHGEINKERLRDGPPPPRDADHYRDEEHDDDFDHEVILGSREKVDEFESLSREDAREKLQMILDQMDINFDGFIDENELTAWIKNSFISLSKEESVERFEEIDEDEDGKITWREVLEDYGIFENEDKDEIALNEPELFSELNEDEKRFQAADKNADGVLTQDEFFAFSHPEDHNTMWDLLVSASLKEKDKDGDGRLSLDEYLGELKGHHNEEWAATEKNRFRMDFDSDNNGYLDREEMLQWLVPNNEEVAKEEAQHLLQAADKNYDGKLSKTEILERQDMFVPSKPSVYGHNIHDPDEF